MLHSLRTIADMNMVVAWPFRGKSSERRSLSNHCTLNAETCRSRGPRFAGAEQAESYMLQEFSYDAWIITLQPQTCPSPFSL